MSIFKRIKDIISANINALLDKFEDPENIIDQMIREMEDSIIEVRKQTASAIAAAKMSERQIAKTEKEVEKWQTNAEMAIESAEDELARKALQRKREVAEQLNLMNNQLKDEQGMIIKMKSDLHLIEEKVQEARRKRETLLMKKRAADAKKKMLASTEKAHSTFNGSANSIINGFDTFTKYEQQIEKELAEAEAHEELNGDIKAADLEQEFAHLQKNNDVEDELAELKKALKKK